MSKHSEQFRRRKAWSASSDKWESDASIVIYAPNAGKARVQVVRESDYLSFRDVTVRRARTYDVLLPVPNACALSLTAEEKNALLHANGATNGDVRQAGSRDYYYTDRNDPILCSLVEKGLMEKSNRGWSEGMIYFFTTPAGKHCAHALMPEYSL